MIAPARPDGARRREVSPLRWTRNCFRPARARGVIPFALVILFAAAAAAATQAGLTAVANWKNMDSCARRAQAAFPDFNADSNAKRDAQLKQCLEGANLPPRQPAMPAPPR
jgi:hypothetical protein